MSAVLVLVQRQRVSLFSDGAAYSTDGRLRDSRSKVHVSPRARTVIAHRGHAPETAAGDAFVVSRWSDMASFDEVVAALPDYLSAWLSGLCSLCPHQKPAEHRVELVAVGWSDARQSFEGWGVSNIAPADRQGIPTLDGYAPFQSIHLPDTWGAPGFDPARSPAFMRRWSGVRREDIEPELFGVEALQAAREGADWEDADDAPIAGAMVGGFIEMVQVTRDGVSRDVLATWPGDRIGEHLDRKAKPEPVVRQADVRALFLGTA